MRKVSFSPAFRCDETVNETTLFRRIRTPPAAPRRCRPTTGGGCTQALRRPVSPQRNAPKASPALQAGQAGKAQELRRNVFLRGTPIQRFRRRPVTRKHQTASGQKSRRNLANADSAASTFFSGGEPAGIQHNEPAFAKCRAGQASRCSRRRVDKPPYRSSRFPTNCLHPSHPLSFRSTSAERER